MAQHFLKISDLPFGMPQGLVKRAIDLKKSNGRGSLLENKLCALLFEKASTRTRASFDAAVKRLGGSTMLITPAESQLGRDEPIKDTARVLSRYVDCLIVRTHGQERLDELAQYASVPVINALTDRFHPCQVMSDVMTIMERTPDIDKVRVAWIGDGNNMANSWIEAAVYFPFELFMSFPPTFEPDRDVIARSLDYGAKIFMSHDPEMGIDDAHYVNTDVWASMGQEGEGEDRKRFFKPYQVNDELMRHARSDAKIMHCLPAHRGEEITESLLEGERSIVWDQAENRMWMQMAVLEWLFGREFPEAGSIIDHFPKGLLRKKGTN